ncbi:MAG: hypothetical protein KF850_20710 [Labilithrix sp.]|nr:hypothetical protein [Labilithrix sp.]MBX3214470.1 hypothetical protein [Labilithrix sp.]
MKRSSASAWLSRLVVSTLALGAGVLACADKEPATPVTAPAPAETTPAAAPDETPSEPAAAPKPRKPFEVYNSCADVVIIAFAADPKAANVGKRTIAPSSAIEGIRNPDGNQTVWLFDANEEPLLKVEVTRGMKRVEIGKSCRTLDAR